MSRITISFFAVLMFFISTNVSSASGSYTLDPTHTYVHFAVSHLGFSTMHGRFDQTSGQFSIDFSAETASVKAVIEASSISTGMKKRDDHLRSPDFFNTIEFPKISYQSTQIKFNDHVPAVIEGELTLLGVTKPVTLTITAFKCGTNPMNKKEMCGIDAEGKLKRSDFGMNYALPGVGDDLKLTIEAEGYKN